MSNKIIKNRLLNKYQTLHNLTGKPDNRVTNSYLVSRESYLVKRIKAKNHNKFILEIELREKKK